MTRTRTAGRARKTERYGITFDSHDEAARHEILLLWERSGIIANLVVKPKFILQQGFTHPSAGKVPTVTWTADWLYDQLIDPFRRVIEDFKGYEFPTFKVKLPFILFCLRDEHVFINPDVNGWYGG